MAKQIKVEKGYFVVYGGEVRKGDMKWSEAKNCWLEIKDFDVDMPVSDYVCISRPESNLESKKPNWYKSGVSSIF